MNTPKITLTPEQLAELQHIEKNGSVINHSAYLALDDLGLLKSEYANFSGPGSPWSHRLVLTLKGDQTIEELVYADKPPALRAAREILLCVAVNDEDLPSEEDIAEIIDKAFGSSSTSYVVSALDEDRLLAAIVEAIEYVGSANYESREKEAKHKVFKCFDEIFPKK